MIVFTTASGKARVHTLLGLVHYVMFQTGDLEWHFSGFKRTLYDAKVSACAFELYDYDKHPNGLRTSSE